MEKGLLEQKKQELEAKMKLAQAHAIEAQNSLNYWRKNINELNGALTILEELIENK